MSSTPYTMPEVAIGRMVYWYPSGDRTQPPHVGFVTGLGFDTLCLNIVSPTSGKFAIKDGVRHVGDARAKTPELMDNGAWDFPPDEGELAILKQRLIALENGVNRLRTDLGVK